MRAQRGGIQAVELGPVRPCVVGLAALTALVILCSPQSAGAQEPCGNPVALFESAQNSVQILQAATRAPRPASRQVPVCAGETIQVGDNSRAVILILASNTPLAIDQNSELVIPAAADGPQSFISLLRGALLYISRLRRATGVSTPFVNASIEGTEFLVRVLADRTVITVFEGAVRAENPAGQVLVGPGQRAVAIQKQAPQIEVVVRPRDAVQWALYYEPILPANSFEALAQIPEANRNALFYVQRAGLLLAVGQLDEAQTDLDQAQKLDPSNSEAYALRAVVAVALNDKEGALTNGRAAVERAPQSVSARVALSYALQANFELEAAREVMQQAVAENAGDGAAWARLAELRLMLEETGGAADAARRAAERSPDLPRVHVVRGFTSLAQLNFSDGEAAFARAIELESDNPLARLGLGLTRIRRGHLADGRSDLELAVAFNPDNAIVRSYLGKAYFDERRATLAAGQLDASRTLDPLDPTPWFYRAIQKQTENQPVSALADVERAIALNDNRAVYRSRFLLDQDLAARSASLARIYRDLGFEQLALVEGWKSVEADSTDHAGHRFLADTYSALPRHEVARVSELLQAQLLQPINLTPVSPRLAETDLFILDGAGPDALAFNEFNPLFGRNRIAAQVSGALGDEDVRADEVVVSGIWNRLSFSAGQFHYGADGLRENNNQDRDIYNLFVQGSVTQRTSVQGEFRWEDHTFGDLFVNFDPTDFVPEQTTQVDGATARLGVRHVFNPKSIVIGSLYWRRQDEDFSEVQRLSGITTSQLRIRRSEGLTGEARHLLRFSRLRLSTGVGWFQSDRDTSTTTEAGFPPFVFRSSSQLVNDQEQVNAYAYSQVDVAPRLTVTLGISGDSYRSDFFDRNQVNPKFGVSWLVTGSTTIRAATFRNLYRATVSSQTIEPTSVSGFNQFFADSDGVEAWRHGVAVDHKFADKLFAGAEYALRDLWVPVRILDEGEDIRRVERRQRSERFARSYLYWTPQNRVSVNLGYRVEDFSGDEAENGFNTALETRTHRVPIGIRYFASSGVTAQLTVQYVNQRGRFFIRGLPRADADRFWVVDGGIGYRLPRRYGRISLDVRNLLNADFRFQNTDPANPDIRKGRLAIVRFTVGI